MEILSVPMSNKILRVIGFRCQQAVMLAIVLVMISPGGVKAATELSNDDLSSILNERTFYSNEEGCSASVSTVSTNLPADIVKNINKLKPAYQKAADNTGVPWQLLAAIHYREANNSPTQDMQAGNPIGGPYTASSTDYGNGYPKSIADSAEIAANHLIRVEKSGVIKKDIDVPTPDIEEVKDVLFSYNGRATVYAQQAADLGFDPKTQPYEGSPYVMNNYDDTHTNMGIITRDHGGLDGTDTRFGAFVIYERLGGATSSPDACSATLSGSAQQRIIQTIVKYAWPDYHSPNYFDMKPEYKAAIDTAIKNGEYVGGEDHPGIDCGGFVTRVMRDSGADPNYGGGGATSEQIKYLNAHPELYENLGTKSSTKDLQPGDIAIVNGHTFFYVGSVPGFNENGASASFSPSNTAWRAPMASATIFKDSNGTYNWYRIKG